MVRCILLSLAISSVVGCRPSPSQPAAVPTSPEERKVVDLANTFLAGQKQDWGEPVKITKTDFAVRTGEKQEGIYQLTYPTSEDEVKLVGERIVIVDLPGQKAEFMPRR